MYANKKILITGATGGIGNSLLEKFNSPDYENNTTWENIWTASWLL